MSIRNFLEKLIFWKKIRKSRCTMACGRNQSCNDVCEKSTLDVYESPYPICQRCWNHRMVGVCFGNIQWPSICSRCADVLIESKCKHEDFLEECHKICFSKEEMKKNSQE